MEAPDMTRPPGIPVTPTRPPSLMPSSKRIEKPISTPKDPPPPPPVPRRWIKDGMCHEEPAESTSSIKLMPVQKSVRFEAPPGLSIPVAPKVEKEEEKVDAVAKTKEPEKPVDAVALEREIRRKALMERLTSAREARRVAMDNSVKADIAVAVKKIIHYEEQIALMKDELSPEPEALPVPGALVPGEVASDNVPKIDVPVVDEVGDGVPKQELPDQNELPEVVVSPSLRGSSHKILTIKFALYFFLFTFYSKKRNIGFIKISYINNIILVKFGSTYLFRRSSFMAKSKYLIASSYFPA